MSNSQDRDSKVIIRGAVVADIPSLILMMGKLASHHGDIPGIDAPALENDIFGPTPWATILVADRTGVLLGYAVLCRVYRQNAGKKGLLIEHLFVEARMRGKGIGQQLVQAALIEAQVLGGTFCTVGTHPENIKAQKFYEWLGFERASLAGPQFRKKLDS
jgi:GNAT superfamily N-acetyltransferase